MQCRDVLLLLSEYSRGELVASQSQEVRAHIGQCASCAQEAALEQKLSQVLRLNAPELPQTMAFSMMQDRVWAQLQEKKQRRFTWLGVFGLASAALLAMLFLWPVAPQESRPRGLPELTSDEIALVDELSAVSPLDSLFELIDVSDLDDESAAALSQKIAKALPAQEEIEAPIDGDDGSYLDELDSLSPEELDRLNTLIEAKKKG